MLPWISSDAGIKDFVIVSMCQCAHCPIALHHANCDKDQVSYHLLERFGAEFEKPNCRSVLVIGNGNVSGKTRPKEINLGVSSVEAKEKTVDINPC